MFISIMEVLTRMHTTFLWDTCWKMATQKTVKEGGGRRRENVF
jgi:hypothetical protein